MENKINVNTAISLDNLPAALLDTENILQTVKHSIADYTLLAMVFGEEEEELDSDLIQQRTEAFRLFESLMERMKALMTAMIDLRFRPDSASVADEREIRAKKNRLEAEGNALMDEAVELDSRMYALATALKEYSKTLCMQTIEINGEESRRE